MFGTRSASSPARTIFVLAAFPAINAEIQLLEERHSARPDGRFWVPLADRYRRIGEVERAEALLREGLQRFPDSVSARIVLGQCLADLDRSDEAVEQFRGVLALDPQNLIALRALGALAAQAGRNDEARRWYDDLLAVDPMNDEARQALDALTPGDADRDAEDPPGELVTETIAELYSQQGLHGHAADVYRQLLQTRGDDSGLRLRLVEAERLASDAVEQAPAQEPTITEALRELLAWPERQTR